MNDTNQQASRIELQLHKRSDRHATCLARSDQPTPTNEYQAYAIGENATTRAAVIALGFILQGSTKGEKHVTITTNSALFSMALFGGTLEELVGSDLVAILEQSLSQLQSWHIEAQTPDKERGSA